MSSPEHHDEPESAPEIPGVIELGDRMGFEAGASARARARWFRRRERRHGDDDVTTIDDVVERRIAETLATFKSERPKVPADMVDEILAHVFTVVEDDAEQRRHRIRIFVTAGGVAAVAGSAIIGVVAFERHTHAIARFIQARRGLQAAS